MMPVTVVLLKPAFSADQHVLTRGDIGKLIITGFVRNRRPFEAGRHLSRDDSRLGNCAA